MRACRVGTVLVFKCGARAVVRVELELYKRVNELKARADDNFSSLLGYCVVSACARLMSEYNGYSCSVTRSLTSCRR
jgi:hypothetical protein